MPTDGSATPCSRRWPAAGIAPGHQFKEQWGAEPHQLYWEYWLSEGAQLPDRSPKNPKFGKAISIWRRLPVGLTRALGPHRGTRLRRLGDPSEEGETPAQGGCLARANGFDLHAGLVVPAGQRERLERVCRYALRPPVTQERLQITDEGQVRLQLRQPWRDGTTDVVFDPVELLGRLAVLVPRPRINLLLYHGVLGPRAAWRADLVRQTLGDGRDAGGKKSATEQARETDPAETARRHARGQCWASLMARTFGFDVLACPRCDGRLRLIALIEEATVIGRIAALVRALAQPRPRSVAGPQRIHLEQRRLVKAAGALALAAHNKVGEVTARATLVEPELPVLGTLGRRSVHEPMPVQVIDVAFRTGAHESRRDDL